MNFGDSFIDCVKMFYNGIQTFVINNDKSSQFFYLYHAVLLFIIAVEYLSTDIRYNKMIKDITIGDDEYLINQLVDDTVLINSEDSLTDAFDQIEHFGVFSDLTLNISKAEIVPLSCEMIQSFLYQMR